MGGLMSHLTMIQASALSVKNWSDHGELHRLVMSFFRSTENEGADNEARASRNILFRVDETSNGKMLMIRSDVAPTNLPHAARTKETSAVSVPAGTPVRFRLTANAIRRSRPASPNEKRGRGISPVDRMEEWVSEKLAAGLGDITLIDHTRTVATSGKAPLQLDVLDGMAVVADAAELEELLRAGVGRSKAFGCGMLTLALA
jgi:CRISPR system Cascade subunit CasE